MSVENKIYLHHATIEVPGAKALDCLKFYQEVLELTIIDSPVRNSAWFEEGIHLYWGGEIPESVLQPSAGIPARHLALVVGEKYLDIWRKTHKLRLFISDGTRYWDSPRCYIADPAGNRIEIIKLAPPS